MNFLGMGPMELLLILVLGLIVFGPGKLPEVMGQVGKAVRDFRRATSELSEEFNRTIQQEVQETQAVLKDTRETIEETRATLRGQTLTSPAPSPAPLVSNGAHPTYEPPPETPITTWSEQSPVEPTTPAGPPAAVSPSPASRTDDDLLPPY